MGIRLKKTLLHILYLIMIILMGGLISCSKQTPKNSVGSVIAIPSGCKVNSFTASSSSINLGASTNLIYSLSGCSSARITHGVGDLTSLNSGSKSVSPSNTTAYSLKTFSPTLYSWTGTSTDGNSPQASPIYFNGKFYGMIPNGGANGYGLIYRMNVDGTDFTNLYSFNNDQYGRSPQRGLVASGNKLYGVTPYNDSTNYGTIFSINLDGTGITLLHTFTGLDGQYPSTTLRLSGTTLYGVSAGGGSNTFGTLFKIETDGSNFTKIYDFESSSSIYPNGDLVVDGDTIYGTTTSYAATSSGTVYSIKTDGTNFTVLKVFSNNEYPLSGLTLSGNVLYGFNYVGGTNHNGSIFKMNKDGTGMSTLYSFSSSNPLLGAYPYGTPLIVGTTIYGSTQNGGSNGMGNIFKISTNGSSMTSMLDFDGTNGEGSNPISDLIIINNSIYGITSSGGANSMGTIFSLPTSSVQKKVTVTVTSSVVIKSLPLSHYTTAEPIAVNGKLYGIFSKSPSGAGSIYSVNEDGSNFTTLYQFTGTNGDGSAPYGKLVSDGTKLYGTTMYGGTGTDDFGTIFSMDLDGTNYQVIHQFNGHEGANPASGLLLVGDTLYGSCSLGGDQNSGTIFSIQTDGTHFTHFHSFQGNSIEGATPGALVLVGSTLYGMTYQSGAHTMGTIYSIDTDRRNFTTHYHFNLTDGAYPNGSLVHDNGVLYGMTSAGGTNEFGLIFSFDTQSRILTTLKEFQDGELPQGSLALYNGQLYGFTSPATSNSGYIFKINLDGSSFTNLYYFTGGADGSTPVGSPIFDQGYIFGNTQGGGANQSGTIFRLAVP